ncbi:hypothetical protein KZX45_13600 [Georgenia sp. EYE_87]|uniref:hypothetical protein n=1 Tax=Georgenia sp. EYE_87 TaxID=2853448 RepID=UPI0020065292|nr:hypothetical protein [Georgenia sp. EYE_87]MCK6211580.1 hypothetical protein [Georgenia sp. EYE_87]
MLAATAAALLLAGCTSSDGGSDGDQADPSAASTAGADVAEELRSSAAPDAEPQPVETALPVIATRATSDGDNLLEIDLNTVSVSGDVMTVVFTARNVGDGRWQIHQYFDDGLLSAPLDDEGTRGEDAPLKNGATTDGVSVIDTTNGTVHRAAYDVAGNCACSVNLTVRNVEPENSLVLTTSFAAPPEDVESVTVQIPGAGAFADVPVNR